MHKKNAYYIVNIGGNILYIKILLNSVIMKLLYVPQQYMFK